ncbi:Bgt-51870 [Blumeria graminis f. sp. tritici]|uniref:Bgt-51870 n=1 Tax=Blumeria graminis f. sp. tritici TaxID=62690 RepID=A0A9X9L811_BLUGR|nr:Bgt-51870 [Blumeria graminis f. sp. tritici]
MDSIKSLHQSRKFCHFQDKKSFLSNDSYSILADFYIVRLGSISTTSKDNFKLQFRCRGLAISHASC